MKLPHSILATLALLSAAPLTMAFKQVQCGEECRKLAGEGTLRELAHCMLLCNTCNLAGVEGFLATEEGSHPNQFARCADVCEGRENCIETCHLYQAKCAPFGSDRQQDFCPSDMKLCLFDCTATRPGRPGVCTESLQV
ncbi:hypothetical protein OC834_007157 [Tilletia horrida]|nr:hypothetical protein OC834_007157 [Tilletia horrida]